MILGFRHKGLKFLLEKGGRRKVRSEYADKIERILARLEESSGVEHMDIPGFRLHRLRGDLAGYWAVSVFGNWRLIFRFDEGHASKVDLLDYH